MEDPGFPLTRNGLALAGMAYGQTVTGPIWMQPPTGQLPKTTQTYI